MLDDDNDEEEEESSNAASFVSAFTYFSLPVSLSVSRLPDISTSIPIFDSPAVVFTRFSIILRLRPPPLSCRFAVSNSRSNAFESVFAIDPLTRQLNPSTDPQSQTISRN